MGTRFYYIDCLKTAAIIAVIALHTSAGLFYSYGNEPELWWWIGNVVDSCTRWAVPVFLLCSGAMLLSTGDESLMLFFQKRIKKVLIPLVAWSLIYYCYKNEFNDLASLSNIKRYVKKILQVGGYYHLTFLYYLLGLYLLTPLLKVFVNGATKKHFGYFFILWIISTVAYPVIQRTTGINIGIPLSVVYGFVGYYIIGFYIHKNDLGNRMENMIYILGILGLIATVLGTYYITTNGGKPNEYFYEYLNISVILPSVAIFVLAKHSVKANEHHPSLAAISGYSFGIYLVHPIFLGVFTRLGISEALIHPLAELPLMVFLVFISSFCLVFVLKKIPFVKLIVP